MAGIVWFDSTGGTNQPILIMEQKQKKWEGYMPSYVNLYPVYYTDSFDEQLDLLQKCVEENSLYPLDKWVLDSWESAECHYLQKILKEMRNDGNERLMREHENDIIDWLYANDQSNAVEETLNNTSTQSFFYDLGVWVNIEEEDVAEKVMRVLGIKDDTGDANGIRELCDNCFYSGSLRIYFEANVEDMIKGNGYSDGDDWKTIYFHDYCMVAIHNTACGSGNFVRVELDKNFKFVRKNLQISRTERWSIEEVCELYGGWLSDCNSPLFDFKTDGCEVSVSEQVKRERKYQRVYEAGGCSFSDDNITRHRGVHYINTVPCGLKCPNCGRFWID